MEREEYIQKYLHGKLSETERAEFEAQMIKHPKLQEAVEEMRDLLEGIKEAERQELKARLQNLKISEEPHKTSKKIINLKPYYLVMAAACVIGFVIISTNLFFKNDISGEELYEDYFSTYPNTMQPIARGVEEIDPTIKAFIAYEAEDFTSASKQFEEILKTKNDPDLKFYYSMSLLNEGRDKEAFILLNDLKRDSTLYVPQTYWYAALIELKNGNKDRGKILIDTLVMLNADFKNKEIKSLKKELE